MSLLSATGRPPQIPEYQNLPHLEPCEIRSLLSSGDAELQPVPYFHFRPTAKSGYIMIQMGKNLKKKRNYQEAVRIFTLAFEIFSMQRDASNLDFGKLLSLILELLEVGRVAQAKSLCTLTRTRTPSDATITKNGNLILKILLEFPSFEPQIHAITQRLWSLQPRTNQTPVEEIDP